MSLNILNSNKKSSRKSKILPQFSISSENKPLLDLLEIQRKSFFDFLQHGIPHELEKIAVFRETAKNSTCKQELELKFNPETYKFISPNFSPKEAILNGKTYACKIYVQATLMIRSPYDIQKTNKEFPLSTTSRENPFSVFQKETLLIPSESEKVKYKFAGRSDFYLSSDNKNKRLNASKRLHNTYTKWLQLPNNSTNLQFIKTLTLSPPTFGLINNLISSRRKFSALRTQRVRKSSSSEFSLPSASPIFCKLSLRDIICFTRKRGKDRFVQQSSKPLAKRGVWGISGWEVKSKAIKNWDFAVLDIRFAKAHLRQCWLPLNKTLLPKKLQLANLNLVHDYPSHATLVKKRKLLKNEDPEIFKEKKLVALDKKTKPKSLYTTTSYKQDYLFNKIYTVENLSLHALLNINKLRKKKDFQCKAKLYPFGVSKEEEIFNGLQLKQTQKTQNIQIFRPWIFLGELPLMTKRGHFILNGSPRVIVNQIARCPGIYFQEKRRGVGIEQEIRVSADLIPQRGPWLRIQSDWEGRFWARLKQEGRVKYATLYEAFQEFEKEYNPPLLCLLSNSYSTNTTSSLFSKSENITFQERKIKEDRQKKALIRLFKNSSRYSLGKLGRSRVNERIHFSFARPSHLATDSVRISQRDMAQYNNYLANQAQGFLTATAEMAEPFSKEGLLPQKGKYWESKPINKIIKDFVQRKEEGFSNPLDLQSRGFPEGIYNKSLLTKNVLQIMGSETGIRYDKQLNPVGKELRQKYNNLLLPQQEFSDPQGVQNGAAIRKGGNLLVPQQEELLAKDLDAIHTCLERLLEGQGFTDDIDNLKNRFIRTSGKLLQQQFELGLFRLNEVIMPLLGNLLPDYPRLAKGKYLTNENIKGNNSVPLQGKQNANLINKLNKVISNISYISSSRRSSTLLTRTKFSFAKRYSNTQGVRKFSYLPLLNFVRTGNKERSRIFSAKQSFAKKRKSLSNNYNKVQIVYPLGKPSLFTIEKVESAYLPCKPIKWLRHSSTLLFPRVASYANKNHEDFLEKEIFNCLQLKPFLEENFIEEDFLKEEIGEIGKIGYSKYNKEVSLIKNAPFRWLRTSKPINSAFREFFGSNPLSQYMDQTNPLAEITHKRRLSSMGPGGIKRETAGMEVRGIHPTHYGRVCPIETPEGKNAGLVNSPTVYGRVGNYGFLETPLYQVIENQVQTKRWTFFSAQHEEKQSSSLATCDTGLLQFNFLAHVPIPVQTANNPLTHFQQVERHRVGYRALSPIQTISIATALIPFLEHDDANRALMGSNMQRQAIPLLSPERPIVGTGFEPLVVMESGQALQATKLGCVSQADANSIIVHTRYSIEKPFPQNIRRDSQAAQRDRSLPWSRALVHKFSIKDIVVTPHSSCYRKNWSSCFLQTPLKLKVTKLTKNREVLSKENLAKPKIGFKSFNIFKSNTLYKQQKKWWTSETYWIKKPYIQIKDLYQTQSRFDINKFNSSSSLPSDTQGVRKCFNCKQLNISSSYSFTRFAKRYGVTDLLKRYRGRGFSYSFTPLLLYSEGVPSTEYRVPRGNISNNLKTYSEVIFKEHISYSHNTFLLQPLKQDLQFYERSNQETCLNQRPLVQEGDWIQKGDFLADSSASHSGDLALGKNVTVAYMPWEGYNFEDAIVISDRLVSDDVYTSLHIERYEIKVSKNSQGKERITNRVPGSSHSLKHLDNFGIARISSWVQPGDILVGKVVELKRPLSPYERLAWELASRLSPKSPEREKWLNKVWLEDISLRLPSGVCGRVINSQIISTEYASMSDKEQTIYPQEVHIYLAVKRKIQIGDKLAGRHGNKGIVSAILPQEDMPYLGDGSCIDMILNPLGVPSRMNLGQIFECLLGLAGSQLGCNFRITPFDEIAGGEASRSLVFLKLYQCRLMYKQQWLFTPTFPGKSKLFDGRTGEPFENWVTVGQAYMLKLIHMVDHKIHARSTGPYSLFTRQPVRGRSRRGGQRLGEMEVWAVEGFGAAYTLQEFLTIKSDDLKARTALQKGFYKQNDVTFGKIHITPGNPEAFKVLVSELQALCLHIQM